MGNMCDFFRGVYITKKITHIPQQYVCGGNGVGGGWRWMGGMGNGEAIDIL